MDEPRLEGIPAVVEPPPPSGPLLDAVTAARPVKTRVPRRTLAWVAVAALASIAWAPMLFTWRRDLPYLPRPWLMVLLGAWLVGFALALGAAVLPRRHQVLPDAARAGRAAAVTALALLALTAAWTEQAPGHSLLPVGRELVYSIVHCLGLSLSFAAGTVLCAALALRRIGAVGARRLGAAAGAAGGALGGLVLQLICAYASTVHVTAAHAGGVVLSALVGATLFPRLIESGTNRRAVPKNP
jgi:hypothetical protein